MGDDMSTADYQHILYEVSDKIATITLNRPERMCAMQWKLLPPTTMCVSSC